VSGFPGRTAPRTGLFLTELIVGILFFAFAGAICVSLFVRAHLVSMQSSDLSLAVIKAQSAAEAFESSDGSSAALAALLDAREQDGEVVAGYDRQGNPQNDDLAAYVLRVRITESNALYTADIRVQKGDEPLYQISTAKYAPGR
jgi:hypothetical protein